MCKSQCDSRNHYNHLCSCPRVILYDSHNHCTHCNQGTGSSYLSLPHSHNHCNHCNQGSGRSVVYVSTLLSQPLQPRVWQIVYVSASLSQPQQPLQILQPKVWQFVLCMSLPHSRSHCNQNTVDQSETTF